MTSGRLLKKMAAACVVLAIASSAIGLITGYALTGAGLAIGLLLGSLNGYLMQSLMARGTPFALSGLVRILLFSSFVLIAALTLRTVAWTIPLGIGLAQLALVAVSVRQGTRT